MVASVDVAWESQINMKKYIFLFFPPEAKLMFFNDFVLNLPKSFELTVEHVQQLPSLKLRLSITSLIL